MNTQRAVLRNMLTLARISDAQEPLRAVLHPRKPGFMLIASKRGIIVRPCLQAQSESDIHSVNTVEGEDG